MAKKMTLDQSSVARLVDALVLGEIADFEFGEECYRLGIPMALALRAPMMVIAAANTEPGGAAH